MRRRVSSTFVLLFAMGIAPTMSMAQCRDAQSDGGEILVEGTLRDVIPADQGTNVPIDTPIRLRYVRRVPTPPVLCVSQGAPRPPCVPGTATVLGDEIVWHAEGGLLAPLQRYYVSYNETGSGMAVVSFVTGSARGPDELFFAGVTDVTSHPVLDDSCDPGAADITVEFDRASSGNNAIGAIPWPEVDVEYVIYQTRGPGISGPRLRDRVRLQRSGSSIVRAAQRTFRLSGADANGPVCFNIQALDPLGRADGNTYERCVNPTRGNYFYGCTVAPRGVRCAGWGALALAAVFFRYRAKGTLRTRRR
jgi:hypothetical protein